LKPMGKPFKFYDEEYDEAKLRSLSLRALRSLQKDAKYADEDLDLWIRSKVQNLPVGSGLHPDIVGKMGYRAAVLRFEREIERAIDLAETDIRDAFYEVCKRDLPKYEFDDLYADAVVRAETKENENED
jgi:hypothetical protein